MIVYDKNTFGSNRDIDTNGYLRVEECNISKCQIRPYLGKEIPNYKEFGLEPDKIYNVYCPKEELEKAAPTFNNLPLTREHIEVDVESVPKEKIVGSLGDHASFEYPYLKNNLIIYDKKDIDLVMSGKKKELSCGYRYTPVKQSGEVDGQHYDFVMTDIIGNHVALVKQGRAGRDVMVADSSKGILETIKEKIMAVFDNDLAEDEFKESEHPRAKNGQFTNAGGSGSEKKEEKEIAFIEAQRKWGKERLEIEREYEAKYKKASSEYQEMLFNGNASKEDLYKKAVEMNNIEKEKLKVLEDFERKNKENFEKEYSSKESKSDLDGKNFKIKLARKPSDIKEVKNLDIDHPNEHVKITETIELAGQEYDKFVKNPLRDYAFLKGKGGYDDDGNRTAVAIRSSGKQTLVVDPSGSAYARYMGILYADDKTTNDKKLSEAEQEKVGVVMKEFKDGELKSGSGEKVTDPKQAIAIALSEADKIAKDKEIPEKQDEPEKAGDEVALNKGEEKMADEVKEAPAEEKVEEVKEEKVTEDACKKAEDKEVKPACDEKEDKRKLIDEIGGILKDKLSEEEWRTVIKKAEELAYNDSETSADDEKKEDLKGKEKEAFAEGVDFGEKKEKEEPKKLDSEHESEGTKKADEKMAKDEAMVMDADAIRAEAREEALADFKARETARKAVRKMVGDVDVFAFDSAEDIYKFACEKSGMDLNEIVSYKDAFRGLTATKSKLALDASPISGSNVECLKDIRIAY